MTNQNATAVRRSGANRFVRAGRYLRRYWFNYLLILPGLCFLLIFSYGPLYGILMGFKDLNMGKGIWGSPWASPVFKYFINFLQDPYFFTVMRNTLIINVMNLVFGFTFIIFLTLMINEIRVKWLKNTVQTAVYLPYFLSWVIFAGIVRTFLSPQDGMINAIIVDVFQGRSVDFLTDNALFRWVLVLSGIIKDAGYGTIIYLAGIAGVSPELYESANVDGANRYHMIRYVTLPRIYPSIAVLLILQISSMFSSNFDQVVNLYNPLVYQSGDVLSTYIYRTGLGSNEFEKSTAINLLFSVISFPIIILANKVINRMDVMGIF